MYNSIPPVTVSWDSDTIRDDLRGDENPTRDPGRALTLILSPEQTGNMPTCFPLPPSPGSSRDARDADAVSTEDLTIEAVIGVATPVSNIATIAREKPSPQKKREKKHTKTPTSENQLPGIFLQLEFQRSFLFSFARMVVMRGGTGSCLGRREPSECSDAGSCLAGVTAIESVWLRPLGPACTSRSSVWTYLTVQNVERIQVSRTDGYVVNCYIHFQKDSFKQTRLAPRSLSGMRITFPTRASPEVPLIWSGITIQHLDKFSPTPSINLNFNKHFVVTPLKYQHPS